MAAKEKAATPNVSTPETGDQGQLEEKITHLEEQNRKLTASFDVYKKDNEKLRADVKSIYELREQLEAATKELQEEKEKSKALMFDNEQKFIEK